MNRYTIHPLQASSLVHDKLKRIQVIVADHLHKGIPPSLTTDLWSNKDSYFISLTIHTIDDNFVKHNYSLGAIPFGIKAHTAENIADRLLDICKATLGGVLDTKGVASIFVTTDSGSNMIRGAGDMAGFTRHPCACHILHNAVTGCLTDIDEVDSCLN